ncbi:MAG: carboxypeptidase regulatory-like domain-containing protein [Steroidobacteraceae bacterium]
MKASALRRSCVLLLTLSFGASASTLTGTVRNTSGGSAAEVFITAHDPQRKMSVTVLSDAKGRYRIDSLFPGTYTVRARKAGFADGSVASFSLEEKDALLDLKLQPEDGAHLATPGAAWLQSLPNSPHKATFITSCTICHDMGSVITRTPRDAAGWAKIIQQMRSQADVYSVIVKMDDAALAEWLAAQHFGAAPAAFDGFSKAAHGVPARLTEYEVGDVTSWAHDMAVDPQTGVAWVGDYVKDQLVSVDPRTGEQKVFASPVRGTGMHTLNFDRDGSLWITFQLADLVARFDTRGGTWRIYGGFARGSLVHSFALDALGYVKKDAGGRIYVSQFGGNRISQLDPATGKVTEHLLPGAATGRPYGVAVDSSGKIWYTKYSENLMGFVDPTNDQGKEWALARPDSGPHRMHIDNADNLWIPLSGYGTILRYNTRDGSQKEYTLPEADTFPYVARYDEKSGQVWITGNGANSLYALDPKTGQIKTFRLPSYLSYGRMISIDYSTGDVWTALSSYPNKHALRNSGLLLRVHHALDLVQ